MNPDAQKRAIAEACGWKPTTDGGICWDARGHAIISPPEYLNDLNAMHEAEKTLKDLQEYCTALAAVVYAPLTDSHEANHLFQGWWFVRATAAQRAEAFLRVIGKWTP